MGAPENLTTNVNKVAYTSYFPHDKILVVDTATNLTSAGTTYLNVPNLLMPIGVYSTDGGANWQECNLYNLNSLNFPDLVPSSKYRLFFRNSGTSGIFRSPDGTVPLVKYVGVALDDTDYTQGYINSGNTSYDTTKNYMKIAVQGSFTYTGTAAKITIPHNLGYVPIAQVWYNDNLYGSAVEVRRPSGESGDSGGWSQGVTLDSTNLYVETPPAGGGVTGTAYYRIYYEN